MATCKDFEFLERSDGTMFDELVPPDTDAPYSGIYRCKSCGAEATGIAGLHLPSQAHHQHEAGQGKIQWQLLAAEKRSRNEGQTTLAEGACVALERATAPRGGQFFGLRMGYGFWQSAAFSLTS